MNVPAVSMLLAVFYDVFLTGGSSMFCSLRDQSVLRMSLSALYRTFTILPAVTDGKCQRLDVDLLREWVPKLIRTQCSEKCAVLNNACQPRALGMDVRC